MSRPAERCSRAGRRLAGWNQKVVCEREASAQPSTFGVEIEGQFWLLNEESQPTPRIPSVQTGERWPEECSHGQACPRSITRAALVHRPSGKSSTTAGTISSPATKSTTDAPWDRCAPMPSPPSAPFSGVAISPPASPAFTRLETGGRRLEGAHSWEVRLSVLTSSLRPKASSLPPQAGDLRREAIEAPHA